MRKKILLLLAFGVTFTPAVFAKMNEPRKTGQELFSQTNPGAIACNHSLDNYVSGAVGSSSSVNSVVRVNVAK